MSAERDSIVRLNYTSQAVEVRAAGCDDDLEPCVWLRALEPDGDGESRVSVRELREALDFVLGGAVMRGPA